MTIPTDQASVDDRTEGRQRGRALKDEAHTILEARRDRIIMQARRERLAALLERATASADDVHECLTLLAVRPVHSFHFRPAAVLSALERLERGVKHDIANW